MRRRGGAGHVDPAAATLDAIAAIADDVSRELRRLRDLVARLDGMAEAEPGLTDEWRVAEDGLVGPDGLLSLIIGRRGAPGARSDAA